MQQTTEDLPGFEQRLLAQLRLLIDERQPTPDGTIAQLPTDRPIRRFVVPVAAAAAVFAATIGVSIMTPGSSGSRAYALETLPSGRIHVFLAPNFDESERLRADLEKAGVDVRPVTITAAPALVGSIELLALGKDHSSARAPKPAGLELGDGEFWIDPERYDGSVEMLMYVSPPAGEPWQQAPSIFHPDQALGGLPCSLEGPLTSARLEDVARQAGVEKFTWLTQAGDPTGDEVRLNESAQRPEGEVLAASLRAPGELEVMVRPIRLVEQFGHVERPSMSLNLHGADEPPCTPELAARW